MRDLDPTPADYLASRGIPVWRPDVLAANRRQWDLIRGDVPDPKENHRARSDT